MDDGGRVRPQLLSEAQSSVARLLNSDQYAMSQKLDGRRILVKTGSNIQAWGRNGSNAEVHSNVLLPLSKVSPGWSFDGELIGDTLHVFDIVECNGQMIATMPWVERQKILQAVLTDFSPHVRIVSQKLDAKSKLQHYEDCMENRAEGVVFCDKTSRYRFGVRSKTSFKYKFVKTIDCFIIDKNINGKDNLTLGLYDANHSIVDIGKVSSMTGDGVKTDFKIGDVVTVKYLYATKAHRLYQPVYPLLRTDKEPDECLMTQMIYKSEKIL